MPKKGKKCKARVLSISNRNAYTEGLCDTVFIGIKNVQRWNELKKQLNYVSDNDFTSYLLDLAVKDLRNSYAVYSESEDFPDKSSERNVINDSELHQVISDVDKVQNKTLHKVKTHSEDSVITERKTEFCERKQELHGLLSSQVFEDKCHKHTKAKTELDNKMTVLQPLNFQGECLNVSKHLSLRREQDKSSNQYFEESVKVKKHKKKKSHEDNFATEDTLGFKHKKRKHKHNEHRKHHVAVESNHRTAEKEDTEKCAECVSTEVELSKRDLSYNTDESNPCTIDKRVDTSSDQDNESQRVAITIKLCCDCDLHHVQNACPLRKAVRVIKDTVNLSEWVNDRTKHKLVTGHTDNSDDIYKISVTSSFAKITLPECLELKITDSKHGHGVFTKEDLPAYVEFGPLIGKTIKEMEIPDDFSMKDIWEIADSTGCTYLSTQDPEQSNWLRWIRPAPTRESRNIAVLLRNRELIFVTTAPLAAGNELLFWADSTNTAWANKKMYKINCGGCNLRFGHPLYYRLHCAVFHDPNFSLTIRKYHCKVCGVSVLGKENIVKHAADNHDGKGAYQCQFCKKFFLRLNYLEIHRTYGCAANPYRTRPLCDYCGRKFCQPQKLKVHIKRMHSEMSEVLREFQCKRCLKLLGSRTALQRHNKEVHRKDIVGACTCDRCGKMFQNKSNLKIHMLTHSGIKPFKCREDSCVAAFTTKQCLQFHYKKVHGFTDSMMPRIERSVAYTFDAYAGGKRPYSVNSNYSHSSTDDEGDQEKLQNSESLNMSPPSHPPEEEHQEPQGLDVLNKIVSKGSKKWLGTRVEHLEGKNNVFDFEENEKTNVTLAKEQPLPVLYRHCKTDSSSASLLVEAAIDAAEKDIDMSGGAKLTPPQPIAVSNKSSEILYPVLRSHLTQSPPQQVLGRPITPPEYSESGPQDHSQSPHLQDETLYSASLSPRHSGYGLMLPERTPHYELHFSPNAGQIETFHIEDSRYDNHHRRTEENSSDDGISVAQNLSVGIKNKPLQLDFSAAYKYDNLEDRNGFEPLEGLDMSRSGNYHHSTFVSMTPRYPHALYDQRTYSHSDVLRVVNLTHSVDLSLPRNTHNQLTPSNQTLIDPIRILSPSGYQSYPLASSPYLTASRPSHSPTYHHYTSY